VFKEDVKGVVCLCNVLIPESQLSYSSLCSYMCFCVPACPHEETPASGLKDQQVLGVWGCCQLFKHSVETLSSQLQEKGEGAELVWDKVKTQLV